MSQYDAAVIGGGIMGCATALHLAENGMRVVVFERRSLCMEASGVNPGTLSLQIKRAALVPYALRGYELWKAMSARFGIDIWFQVRGGLTLAFDEGEAETLVQRMTERRAAGAPVEIVTGDQARALEPGLSKAVVLASYCPLDGYANASLTGVAFGAALMGAGAVVREGANVTGIDRDGDGYTVRVGDTATRAARIVIAGGVWLNHLSRMLGSDLPIHCRVNMVSVTERCRPIVRMILGHALGVLTLKQSHNGTVLIGGGWQGSGDRDRQVPTEVVFDNLRGNLRLAVHAVPRLVETRLVRVWHGLEAHVPDFLPLVGPLAGLANAFVIGCVRGGYTIGPYVGQLLGEAILGRQPERPLFDPNRFAQASVEAGAQAPVVRCEQTLPRRNGRSWRRFTDERNRNPACCCESNVTWIAMPS
ncbi:MAG: NAD(P)/FAD-dependent oxidoreductase [Vicinamibacterales bacterium]